MVVYRAIRSLPWFVSLFGEPGYYDRLRGRTSFAKIAREFGIERSAGRRFIFDPDLAVNRFDSTRISLRLDGISEDKIRRDSSEVTQENFHALIIKVGKSSLWVFRVGSPSAFDVTLVEEEGVDSELRQAYTRLIS